MDTWIFQGGYPLVQVGDDGSLPSRPSPTAASPVGAIGSQWQVPILFRDLGVRDATSEALLLEEPTLPGSRSGVAREKRAARQRRRFGLLPGFVPRRDLERLAGGLGELAPLERYNLVSDTWAAALAGRAPLADLLRLARAMADGGEGDPSVWSVVIGALGLFDRVVPDAGRPTLAGATRSLLAPLESALGWEPRPDDGERTPALRASVLRTLGTIGDDTAVKAEAAKRFARAASTALHPDTESAVLEIVASEGGTDEFDAFLERYRNPANPQQEMRYLYALSAFDDPVLAARTFELAVTEVRTQNAPFLLQALLANRATGAGSWNRVTQRWDTLVDRFPANTLPRMLDGVRRGLRASVARRGGHPVRRVPPSAGGWEDGGTDPRASGGERGLRHQRSRRARRRPLRRGRFLARVGPARRTETTRPPPVPRARTGGESGRGVCGRGRGYGSSV